MFCVSYFCNFKEKTKKLGGVKPIKVSHKQESTIQLEVLPEFSAYVSVTLTGKYQNFKQS